MCFVPIVFRDEVLGLLVLYHRTGLRVVRRRDRPRPRVRRPHRRSRCRTPGWPSPSHALAERLGAISELAVRLNRIQDIDGIAGAIVGEARRLIDHDTIRVYRVDHDDRRSCEPIAFQGTFLGSSDPDPETPARRRSARA